jgi:hypothetical protein
MVENEIEDNGKEVAKNSLSQESKKRWLVQQFIEGQDLQ